jgi:hypothetical protein
MRICVNDSLIEINQICGKLQKNPKNKGFGEISEDDFSGETPGNPSLRSE